MAKKSGPRPASSGSAQSNTGLVVSLVIFVLLTLGLGVATYFGFAGQEDLRRQAADANSKAKAAEAKARDEEAQKLALRLAAGFSDPTDKTAFSNLKSATNPAIAAQIEKFNSNFAALARQLAGDETLVALVPKLREWAAAKWDIANNDTPPKSYIGLLDEVSKAFKAQVDRHKAQTLAYEEEKKRLTDEIQNLQGALQKAQAAVKEANDKVIAEQSKKTEAFDQASAQIKRLSEQLQQVTNEKQQLDAERTAEIRRLEAKLDSLSKVREQFQSRVGPILESLEKMKIARPEIRELAELHELLLKQFDTVQALSNDVPKGTIVKIDRNTGLAYVNLGSADNIRPGVTFSVLPAGSTGKAAAARERKGAIEIVSVLEPHLSSAMIIDAGNPVRDPLLPGDLLFNPAWNPAQREHVAIAGIIDINGDGVDDTQELIRTLERQGVIVDAYLDLKERAIKGPGMTERTTYLLMGEKPILPPNVQLENNPLSQAALDVLARMEEMRNKARELGAQPVNYRRFLAMIGYKLPKVTDSNVSASTYLRGLSPKNVLRDDSAREEKPK